MDYKKEKIALIGANSILAQSLYERLKADFDVVQVYHIQTNKIKNLDNCVQIDDFISYPNDFSTIYFFSSCVSFNEDIESVTKILDTNVKLLLQISKVFTKAKIIHSSSVSVYGVPNEIITESTGTDPLSSYALSKLWAEKIVTNHLGGGVNIRLSSLFGAEMNGNTFLPKVIHNAFQNNEITVFGDGSRKQNYIGVKEVSNYFYKALSYTEKMPLLAVGDKSYSNYEIAQLVQNLKPDITIRFLGEDLSPSFEYNNAETKKKLMINEDYSFESALNELILWTGKQF